MSFRVALSGTGLSRDGVMFCSCRKRLVDMQVEVWRRSENSRAWREFWAADAFGTLASLDMFHCPWYACCPPYQGLVLGSPVLAASPGSPGDPGI